MSTISHGVIISDKLLIIVSHIAYSDVTWRDKDWKQFECLCPPRGVAAVGRGKSDDVEKNQTQGYIEL